MIEPSIAKFLVARGHRVTVTLCDGSLNACLSCSIWNQPKAERSDEDFTSPQKLGICDGCFKPAYKMWASTGAEIFALEREWQTGTLDIRQSFVEKELIINDIDYGEDVVAGCLRFLCKGDKNSISETLWNAYVNATIKIVAFYSSFIAKNHIDVAFSVHGIYVPHGIVNKLLQKHKILFYNYNTSYREKRFYFTKNDTYHKVLPGESHEELSLDDASDAQISSIVNYLESREYGGEDWQQFNNEPDTNVTTYLAERNFDLTKETAVLFSNVVWDARLHFFDNTYPDMVDWVNETIACFAKMPHRNLIIRVHPGEIISHSVSRERLRDLPIMRALPDNVIVIDAEEKLSSYALARIANLNLVYASKIAMELCRMDAPIITCGDAWIKNKGATLSPKTAPDYVEMLMEDWGDLARGCNKRRGLSYAHYIFESKPLKFNYLEASKDRKSFDINKSRLVADIRDFENNALHRIECADITDL
ncbi:hypothetical protein N9Y68_05320 [Luminiphilus sp.]|nr:hypothetical protein [Luminiphilus sp.]